MRKKIFHYIVILSILCIVSCESSGNLFLDNAYLHDVVVFSTYEYSGEILERRDYFWVGKSFAPAAMRHVQYNNLQSMRIENIEGDVLADYAPEYLMLIRNHYMKKSGKMRQESWIFTEKGLFLKTRDIARRYKFDSEKILEYYRSDEVVKDFEEM